MGLFVDTVENAASLPRTELRGSSSGTLDFDSSYLGLEQGGKYRMKEEEVRRLVGLPREDWIKQVVQNSRVYSVWIYPKADGGASAIYFDNGVVYHTNWNAAAPQPQAAK